MSISLRWVTHYRRKKSRRLVREKREVSCYAPFFVVVCTIDFLTSFNFCPGWLCYFKWLFIPVWREIHRWKISPVTSWQLTNKRLRVSAWHNLRSSRNTPVFDFFPRKFITWFKSIQVKQVDRRDFVARFVATSLKLASRNYERSTCNKFFLYLWLVHVSFLPRAWLTSCQRKVTVFAFNVTIGEILMFE